MLCRIYFEKFKQMIPFKLIVSSDLFSGMMTNDTPPPSCGQGVEYTHPPFPCVSYKAIKRVSGLQRVSGVGLHRHHVLPLQSRA